MMPCLLLSIPFLAMPSILLALMVSAVGSSSDFRAQSAVNSIFYSWAAIDRSNKASHRHGLDYFSLRYIMFCFLTLTLICYSLT